MSDSYPRSKFFKFIWAFNALGFALLILIAIPQGIEQLRYSSFNFFQDDTPSRGIIVGKSAERAERKNIELQHLVYERPVKIESSDYYYSSVVVLDRELPREVLDDIQSASDFSIYLIGASINILFYSEDRKDVHPLLPNNGYIHSIRIGREYSYRNDSDILPFALYQIATTDDNDDSRINDQDSMPFYLSDLDGKNLKKITPDSLSLDSYWFSEDFNTIYFDEIISEENNPLAGFGFNARNRKVYYYDVRRGTFELFSELQSEFEKIQNSFTNSN